MVSDPGYSDVDGETRITDMPCGEGAAATVTGELYRISISVSKGEKKSNVDEALLKEALGIVGDAHAGSERQVSLLPFEAFDSIRRRLPDIRPGDFAENITTRSIDLSSVSVGDHLYIGDKVRLEVTQIGKVCHNDCLIKQAVGDCIMPRLGIFASVLEGGSVRVGDRISLKRDHD
jgi:MOSC domain-containing protein YiiM